LLKKYNQLQASENKVCWASLDILPFSSWIQRLWQAFALARIEKNSFLLSAQHELVLWEEIIKKSSVNESLLQLSETAELAKSAWDTLKQWQVNLSDPALQTTADSSVFLEWAEQFQQLCVKNNWLDTNSLIERTSKKIQQKLLKLPLQIIMIGFTEFSPQQKHLLSCCEQAGSKVIYHENQPNKEPLSLQRISLADEDTEICTMARWAKALLEENQLKKTDVIIGCVVPHLEKIRDHLASIFAEVFSKDKHFNLDPTCLPFNISAGKSLAAYPIIHAALQLLNLCTETITIEVISSLLRSPFIGEAEHEQACRAQFDSRLRSANIMHTSLSDLINPSIKPNLVKSCPHLAKRIEKFMTALRHKPNKLSISHWLNVFLKLLALLGWPGERSINSHEYQIVQRWLELLQEYQAFDMILPPTNYSNALHYLIRLTKKNIFQPQSVDAPIQILGILEAAELPFDHVWIMGLDDMTWPASAKPNPFIPYRLQKALNMPHATADKEFAYSKKLTEQLQQSARNCIFSHAIKNAECEFRPSPLTKHAPEIKLAQLTLSSFISPAQHILASRMIELLQDEQAPAISTKEKMPGGTAIFKQQAACPFKAFAEIRLQAKPLESPTLGLRAQDRGKIIHRALEYIWRIILTSAKLAEYDNLAIEQLLTACISQAIHTVTGKEPAHSRYLSLEADRLQNLLWHWMQLEKNRPPFKVIQLEEESTVVIGNLTIQLRVDRIDELAEGGQLIIDYKTGKNNQIKYWFGNRPEEPQLPLYCTTGFQNTLGIAFAEISADSLTLKGISKKNLGIASIKLINEIKYNEHRLWDEQIQVWQSVLEKLANDFYQGHAQVQPKQAEETCRHCHLHPLCRINENL
jgi:ATP-dependent helicase/nuclease subunit B